LLQKSDNDDQYIKALKNKIKDIKGEQKIITREIVRPMSKTTKSRVDNIQY